MDAEQLAFQSMLLCLEETYGEDLFSDMDMADFNDELTGHEVRIDGKWISMTGDYFEPEFLEDWRLVIIPDNDEYYGICREIEKTVEITESFMSDDSTRLHELIHVYESVLRARGEHFPQYVIIRLYEKLRSEIPELIRKLNADMHLHDIVHTPLFLLKSLDLDLRCGFPLGTVYGYGRKEWAVFTNGS